MIKLESTSLFYQSCALLINSSHYNSDHITYMKNWKKLDPWRNDFIKNKEKCLIQRQVFVYLSLRNVRKYLQSILLNSKTFFEVWIFYFKRWYLSWKPTKNWAPYLKKCCRQTSSYFGVLLRSNSRFKKFQCYVYVTGIKLHGSWTKYVVFVLRMQI